MCDKTFTPSLSLKIHLRVHIGDQEDSLRIIVWDRKDHSALIIDVSVPIFLG